MRSRKTRGSLLNPVLLHECDIFAGRTPVFAKGMAKDYRTRLICPTYASGPVTYPLSKRFVV
jgi:hypothetical protein